MRRPTLVLAAALALVAGSRLLARAGDAPATPDLPKPPTTPLPKFENPLHDCEVGETLFYKVQDTTTKDGWVRYFEERVLARTSEKALLETVETDATGTKVFGIDNDPRNTGWRPIPEELKTGTVQTWLKDREKAEIFYVGDPPKKAVRATHRFLQEPEDMSMPDGPKRVRQIWFSHDVPATGRIKMFPAQGGGERTVISWDKRLSPEECAKRAGRYPDLPPQGPESPGTSAPEAGMGEPGMEPGMGEPGMGEPGMGEPGMEEPGMGEPPMDDGGMKG